MKFNIHDTMYMYNLLPSCTSIYNVLSVHNGLKGKKNVTQCTELSHKNAKMLSTYIDLKVKRWIDDEHVKCIIQVNLNLKR